MFYTIDPRLTSAEKKVQFCDRETRLIVDDMDR
jgi:hypothetical protein